MHILECNTEENWPFPRWLKGQPASGPSSKVNAGKQKYVVFGACLIYFIEIGITFTGSECLPLFSWVGEFRQIYGFSGLKFTEILNSLSNGC